TAGHLAPLATASTFGIGFKTAHGPVSPIWMRPDQQVYQEGAALTASNFSNCAYDYWPSNTPGFTLGVDPGAACDYEELGNRWVPPSDAVAYTDVNIGITGGTRSSSGTVDTVNAAGTDIFGTADQFLYSYKLASGDGQATVKVNSLTNTNAFAKAGIMFRHTNAANAVNTMVAMTPTSGAHFQYRNTAGGSTTSFTLAGHSNPRWLKLARAGRSFVGYVSSDQQTWTQVGTPITLPAANFPEGSLSQVGLAVTSHNAASTAQAVFDHFAWLPASPDTLVDANIGISNGSRSFRKGVHTIQAGGADIYGTSDQFFYAFQSDAGTGTLSAKVTGIGNTDPYAKAGVMYRNSSAENSAHVMMEITASQGAIFQYRTSPGASATSVIVAGHSAPKFVRIERAAGGVFTGKVSTNGSTWTTIGTVTIPTFNDPALVGLAVTSHNTGAVTTATFTDVVLP
ncbi:MAG TPA: hypothetical protein VMG12_13760, partial [Polyangiaceae bacterium]|nr:hypothetical protein [Polyangiaceae bacterium]